MAAQLHTHDLAHDEQPFSVTDYVQLACMGRHTVRIEAEVEGAPGTLLVNQGQLWSAKLGKQRGLTALRSMLDARRAHVHVAVHRGAPGAPNLPQQPYEHILLELARQHDEDTRNDGASRSSELILDEEDPFEEPSPVTRDECTVVPLEIPRLRVVSERPSTPPPPPRAPRRSFEGLLAEGADALLRKDYHGALSAYRAALALRPDHGLAHANVERLRELIARHA